jgi:hypothetical protein
VKVVDDELEYWWREEGIYGDDGLLDGLTEASRHKAGLDSRTLTLCLGQRELPTEGRVNKAFGEPVVLSPPLFVRIGLVCFADTRYDPSEPQWRFDFVPPF